MTKQLKALAIALVAVIVLGVALFFVMKNFGEDSEASSVSSRPDTTVSLHSSTLYDITSIAISNEKGETLIENLGNTSFGIRNLEGLPVLEDTISLLAANCANLTARDTVMENVTDLSLYGLAAPRATLTINSTAGSYVLEIGNDAPGGTGIYVKEKGNATVYLLSAATLAPALRGELEFLDLSLTPIDADFTLSLRTLYLGGTGRIAPVEGGMVETNMYGATQTDANGGKPTIFKIIKPTERNYNTTKGDEIFATVFQMQAEQAVAIHPTAEQLAAYGLDEPYTDLQIGYSVDTELRLRVSEPKDGYAYLLKDDIPVVYQIATDGLLWIDAQYQDFVMSLLLLAYINDVSSVDVVSPDVSYTFEIHGEDDNMTVWYQGKQQDLKRFKSLYQNFIGVPADQYTVEQPAEGAEPLLSITFHYDDQRPSNTLSFYPGPPRQAFMELDGFTEFLTRSTYVEKVLEDCEKFLAGEEVYTIY